MDGLPTGLLALPAHGDGRVAALDRKLGLLVVRALLTEPLDGVEPATRRALLRLRSWLAARLRDTSDAVVRAVQAPEVQIPLLAWLSGACPPGPRLRAAAPALLIELAAQGAAKEGFLWDLSAEGFLLGDRRVQGSIEGLYAINDRVEFRVKGQLLRADQLPGEIVLHPITETLSLSCTDPNPLAMNEAHPDKAGNRIDLGGREPGDWVRALREALALVSLGLPTWHTELAVSLRRLVPVGFEAERHLSASYREAPSQAYLTLHPDPLTLAEAIVHETQHGKLNRLTWFDAVLENGRSVWTSSPVRPDLRPLLGVLLAAHAFVPVAALHLGLARAGHPIAATGRFVERRAEVRAQNESALSVLRALGEPTAMGRGVIAALEALHAATA